MASMWRAVVLFTLLVLPSVGQGTGTLHVRVTVADAAGNPAPVPRHALLVSANPTIALPRRVLTGIDGTANIVLKPGNYTIESERPAVFQGKAYEWTQIVDVAAGRDVMLDLTAANADVVPMTAAASDTDPSFFVAQWQPNIVTIWTPLQRADGFVLDPRGLVATTHTLVGSATSVEVQISRDLKVAGQVLTIDKAHDVAMIRVNPEALTALASVPLPCAQQAATIAEAQKLLARRESDTVLKLADACSALPAAEKKMTGDPPSATHLPVEPPRPFPLEAMKDAAKHRAGSLKPYEVKSESFDLAFFTPIQTYSASVTTDFANWSEYVAEYHAVLMIRATPKLVESFWTTVARGAARTQGVELPPIKHIKAGFAGMRAFCGTREVTPIHPLRIERRVSETDAVYEGFYVFDPAALGPECGTVTLQLSGDKRPDKSDTQAVDPKILEQIRQDFEPARASR